MNQIVHIPLAPYYGLSLDGRVWSSFPRGPGKGRPPTPWRELKPRRNKKTGYLEIALYVDGKQAFSQVHVLMATVFVGPKPGPGYEVRHLDGRRLNNAWDNLAWGTPLENHDDRLLHGTSGKGEQNSACTLPDERIDEIRQFLADGGRQCEAVRLFGVSGQHVSNINSGKRRAHA